MNTSQTPIDRLADRFVEASDGHIEKSDAIKIFTSREGKHFMDGHPLLKHREAIYFRPWNDCIPVRQLNSNNLPPFLVRLRDDQVKSLIIWAKGPYTNTISGTELYHNWPHDFSTNRMMRSSRKSWGPGSNNYNPDCPNIPTWKELPFPPTFKNSGRIMATSLLKAEEEGAQARELEKQLSETRQEFEELKQEAESNRTNAERKEAEMAKRYEELAQKNRENEQKILALKQTPKEIVESPEALQRKSAELETQEQISEKRLLEEDTDLLPTPPRKRARLFESEQIEEDENIEEDASAVSSDRSDLVSLAMRKDREVDILKKKVERLEASKREFQKVFGEQSSQWESYSQELITRLRSGAEQKRVSIEQELTISKVEKEMLELLLNEKQAQLNEQEARLNEQESWTKHVLHGISITKDLLQKERDSAEKTEKYLQKERDCSQKALAQLEKLSMSE